MANPDLYNESLYNNNEYNIWKLLLLLQRVFVKVEAEAGENWDIYNAVLYSESGRQIIELLGKYQATSHQELRDIYRIKQQTANKQLQRLIEVGLLKSRDITGDPQLKGRYRPFKIYYLAQAEPQRVVEATLRLKKLIRKDTLSDTANEAYDNIEDLAAQVIENYPYPEEKHYKQVLTQNGIKTEEEWKIFVPQMVRKVRELREAGLNGRGLV